LNAPLCQSITSRQGSKPIENWPVPQKTAGPVAVDDWVFFFEKTKLGTMAKRFLVFSVYQPALMVSKTGTVVVF
jgi:hypothetical protein